MDKALIKTIHYLAEITLLLEKGAPQPKRIMIIRMPANSLVNDTKEKSRSDSVPQSTTSLPVLKKFWGSSYPRPRIVWLVTQQCYKRLLLAFMLES